MERTFTLWYMKKDGRRYRTTNLTYLHPTLVLPNEVELFEKDEVTSLSETREHVSFIAREDRGETGLRKFLNYLRARRNPMQYRTARAPLGPLGDLFFQPTEDGNNKSIMCTFYPRENDFFFAQQPQPHPQPLVRVQNPTRPFSYTHPLHTQQTTQSSQTASQNIALSDPHIAQTQTQPQTPETQTPETQTPETQTPETQTPETQTQPQTPEIQPETPETQTQETETQSESVLLPSTSSTSPETRVRSPPTPTVVFDEETTSTETVASPSTPKVILEETISTESNIITPPLKETSSTESESVPSPKLAQCEGNLEDLTPPLQSTPNLHHQSPSLSPPLSSPSLSPINRSTISSTPPSFSSAPSAATLSLVLCSSLNDSIPLSPILGDTSSSEEESIQGVKRKPEEEVSDSE